MTKYAPKHSEVSGGAKPRPTFSGHKATRLAVTAATTIAMTGSSLLAPFSAFANDVSDTTAQNAIMSPLAVHAGEAAGSAVKADAQKIADLQAAIDAAKAAEADAKSDYDTVAAPIPKSRRHATTHKAPMTSPSPIIRRQRPPRAPNMLASSMKASRRPTAPVPR